MHELDLQGLKNIDIWGRTPSTKDRTYLWLKDVDLVVHAAEQSHRPRGLKHTIIYWSSE